MFNFMKKNTNKVINFVKEADIEIAQAYRSNNASELKNYMGIEMFRTLRQDITARNANNDRKYEAESFITREYEVLEDSEDVCVIKRNVIFKTIKNFSHKFDTGMNFSELITVSKNSMSIMSIVAA